MKFPLLNISEDTWEDEDAVEYTLYDAFIYTDSQAIFEKYLKDKLFCDCDGVIFIVKSRILPTNWWRKTFRFLPNVYKAKLVFEKTEKTLSIDQLRTYVIEGVKGLSKNEITTKWLEDLKHAQTFEEIIK